MKKMKYFTAKVLAVILAGALTAGSLSVSAFGAEESPGIADTSEMEIEDLDSADPSDPADTVPSDSDTSGEDDADDAEIIYTVTLDANGGYFEDVWDDVLEEYVDRAEIIKKAVPAGDSIEVFPVFSQDDQSAVFQGWSLDREGDPITQEYGKFVPEEDCTLYAVWETEPIGDIEDIEDIEDIDGKTAENTEEKTAENTEENPNAAVDADLLNEDESEEGSTEEQVTEEYIEQQKVTVSESQQDMAVNSAARKIVYSGSLGDNLTWTLDEEGTLIIAGSGDMADGRLNYLDEVKKAVIEDGVTSIGTCAFENCESLTEVTLPGTLDRIGDYAFEGCTGMSKIVFPEGIKSIGNYAFNSCTSLAEIDLPESLRSIGHDVFAECSSLKSARIPGGIKNVGAYMFQRCTALTDVYLEEGLEEIGDTMFMQCSSLKQIDIPDSVKKVGSGAFTYCSGLTRIDIPKSVLTIEPNIVQYFSECNNLTRINVDPDNPVYSSEDGVLFSKDKETLICCPPGKSGDYVIPEEVCVIEELAFSECKKLTSVSISDNVQTIGNFAFTGCTGIETITIPGNVFLSWNGVFNGCTSLQEIQLKGTSTDYYTVDGVLFMRRASVDGKEYQNILFCYPAGKQNEYYQIPEGTELISGCGFCGADYLKDIQFPSSLVAIDHDSFRACTGLEEIVLPDGLESIGETAFYQCRSLQKISVPDSVVNIKGTMLFHFCDNLETIICSITSEFYQWAVENGYLSKVQTEYGTVSEGVWEALVIDGKTCSITRYSGNGKAVKIPDTVGGFTVTGIAEKVFFDHKEMVSVTIPSSVSQIGPSAFAQCSALQNVVLPDKLKTISESLFNWCGNLKEIRLPAQLEKIAGYSFQGCSSLSAVDIPDSVVEIGNAAFDSCGSLKTVSLPKQLKRIENDLFSYSVIETIMIPDGVESIGICAFSTCTELKSVVIPSSVRFIGEGAFESDDNLRKVYYTGTKKEWQEIYIEAQNDALLNAKIQFEYSPVSIEDAEITGIKDMTFTGKRITQSPVVTLDQKVLAADIDYKLSYENNIHAGTAAVTITGIDNYFGTRTETFKIKKAGQAITVKSTASSINVGKTATVSISGAKGTKSFKSSNTAVAIVNATTGVVTGKKPGTVTITAASAATSDYKAASGTVRITVALKKPGDCRFVKWNNAKYNSCRIAWNKVEGADGYQSILSWTDGSHATTKILNSSTLAQNCSVAVNHVSQFKVRAFTNTAGGKVYSQWSNISYITPSPTTLKYKSAGTSSAPKADISWNIIYGCNGYNVFLTTNPNGTWYWNQSTSTKAASTSAAITKYRGAKLKKGTRYYVRIVTRRQRNGVFCTVPLPAKNTSIGSFVVK